MRSFIITFSLLLTGLAVHAQDYFSDRNNTGTPIYFAPNGGSKSLLFSAGVNTSDASSAKVNIYSQYWGAEVINTVRGIQYGRTEAWGWGANVNAATKDGLGKVFKSGNFDPGFTGGAYLSKTIYKTEKNAGVLKTWGHSFILSSNIGFANYQFYNSAAAFASQFSTKNFTSPSIGFSYVNQPCLQFDDVFWGFSVNWKKTNNYDDLDNYEIKNDSVTTSGGITRHVTAINPKGDTYAVGDYQEFGDLKLRFNYSYIPAALQYRFGFTVYPSADFGGPTSARVNTGFSFSYLKDKSPTLSILSLNMEFNDIGNAVGSAKPFLKRSFKVGVSANLNLITGP